MANSTPMRPCHRSNQQSKLSDIAIDIIIVDIVNKLCKVYKEIKFHKDQMNVLLVILWSMIGCYVKRIANFHLSYFIDLNFEMKKPQTPNQWSLFYA